MKVIATLLLLMASASDPRLTLAESINCKNAGRHLTDEAQVLLAIKPGITTADEAKACLLELNASYGFATKRAVDSEVPKFYWRSPRPKGLLRGVLPGRRMRWFVLAEERIEVEIEIDDRDRVAQVVTRKVLTGL